MVSLKNYFISNRFVKDARISKYFYPALILFIVLAVIYGNSLDCSWHFDDFSNIVENENIKLTELSWPSIEQTFHGTGGDRWNRPLSYFTFASNYYLGGMDVSGYHLVNLSIHYLTALFLFLLIYRTLNLPLLRGEYGKESYPVACLAALLWAVSPLHVSAVTYIVQRMASMAAMFCVMSMYFYLEGRTAEETRRRILFYGLSGITALLSFASKENAAMLPVSLFFYDLFLIQGVTTESLKKNARIFIAPLVILLAAAIYYTDMSSIISGYEVRTFTLKERLLTEPRVILFYISLLLYPITGRLTLLHDFQISKGIMDPWTTLPAIILVLACVLGSFILSKKKPLIAYCVLFFFINHAIEGTVIPLEIVYGHRNYLPALMFFVPLSIVIVRFILSLGEKKLLKRIAIAGIAGIMLMLAFGVHEQNEIFKDEWSLWFDNVEKSPDLHRPHHNLALAYRNEGFLPGFLDEIKKALNAKDEVLKFQKCLSYFEFGQYYLFINEKENALKYYLKSLNLAPFYPDPLNGIAKLKLLNGELVEADRLVRQAILMKPQSAEFQLTWSVILVRAGKYDDAVTAAVESLRLNRDYLPPWIILAEVSRLRGETEKARGYFERFSGLCPTREAAQTIVRDVYQLLDKAVPKEDIISVEAFFGNEV
jgi:protein O-mannosyl-transferase